MSKATILIAEDEAIVAEDLAGKLRRLGYEVAGITSEGEEAVALACRLNPALVLMDISLDGPLDGIEAAEAIRRQHDVPVIYLTAHSDPATLDRAKITDPFGYILKPFDERDLATQIELALYKHQADRQIRQQREWLRVTLTSIGDAVIATDAEGCVTFLNPVAQALTGWKAEDAAGQPVQCVFHIVNEQTGQAVEEPVARVLREGRAVELANHTALVTKDGRTVPIEDSAAPILDATGQVIGVVLVFHDVTEKRRAEEAALASRAKLEAALASMTDAVFISDAEGRFIDFNDAFATFHRFKNKAECAKTFAEYPDLLDVFMADGQLAPLDQWAIPRALRGETTANAEYTLRRKDTGETWVGSYSFAPIRDRDGRIVGSVVAGRDITEQKRAAAALRESEARVRRKLESVLTPEGDIGTLELSDVMDAESVQALMDDFCKISPLPMSIIDVKGKVLVGVGWQRICTQFHRVHPETCRHCTESDLHLTAGIPPGESRLYKCRNQMWDIATPIYVGEQHLGYVFSGQFFFDDEAVDEEAFRAQAQRYGFDEEDYLAALAAVPRLSRATIHAGMAFFIKLAKVLSQLGYSNVKLARSLAERATLMSSLRESQRRLETTLNSITGGYYALDGQWRFVTLNSAAEQHFGRPAAELIGQSIWEVTAMPPEADLRCRFEEARQSGQPLHFEAVSMIRPDFWAELHLYPRDGLLEVYFSDISARKQAEGTLRESEHRLRTLGDQIPGGAVYQHVRRPDGRVEYAYMSAGIERLLGLSAERVMADPDAFRQLVVEDDRARLAAAEERSARDLTPFDCEFRQRAVAGEIKWVQCRSMPRRLEDGSILWDGVVVDITERKRREEQIVKLTRLYAVLSQVNEAIVRASDTKALYSEVCRIVAEKGGFPLAWIGQIQDQQVVPVAAWGSGADYVNEIRVEVHGELGRGPTGTCIRENRAVVNDDFAVSPATSPWREAALRYGFRASAAFPLSCGGQVVATITLYASAPNAFDAEQVGLLESLSADLSYALDALDHEQRRVHAEQALRENERRLAVNLEGMTRLQDLSTQLVQSGDLDSLLREILAAAAELTGTHKGNIQFLDPSTGRLRIAVHQGLGQRFLEHFASDGCVATCSAAQQAMQRVTVEDLRRHPLLQGTADLEVCLEDGILAIHSTPLVSRDGRLLGMLSNHFPIPHRPAEHELRFLDMLARMAADLIERKRSESDLAAAKLRAEQASEAKSQFLANMSHELRTPMNAILGMIDVALPKATDPIVQDCLQTAKGSADLLLTLLNDLLDSAKIESGRLELESAPFSLRRMLDQITRVLSVRASEKGLCFCCRMPHETPDVLTGDRMRLQQVLLNLAGNAIKFTERGEVEIGLRALSHDGEVCLEFAVRDTGIGIPPSGLKRLFQPFVQSDASMARRFGGTGLGLSISKNLVEMMGGRIWVESEVGKGSTFHFTVRLPLAKELPPDFEAPAVLPAACGQLRVLLVEDNPANQKLATYILRDRGHVVEVAADGQEALRLTERNRYDVILMDVQMPGMNGLEATAAIRKREECGSRVPIIAMTAHAMKGDRERCLAAGMDAYLSKPVNAREMIGLVEGLACGTVSEAQLAAAVLDPAEAVSCETLPVFNPEEALTRCFNSANTVREMIQCFQDEVTNLFPQMRAALEKGDLSEAGRLGHRMKGTVVYLGAERAKEAALRLERFCQSTGGTASEAEEAVRALEQECIALQAALVRHPLSADLRIGG